MEFVIAGLMGDLLALLLFSLYIWSFVYLWAIDKSTTPAKAMWTVLFLFIWPSVIVYWLYRLAIKLRKD